MREHQRGHRRAHAVTHLRAIHSSCTACVARGFPALPAVPASLLDGKEGVSGSSPEEGFPEMPAKRAVELSQWETAVTRGHSRA